MTLHFFSTSLTTRIYPEVVMADIRNLLSNQSGKDLF